MSKAGAQSSAKSSAKSSDGEHLRHSRFAESSQGDLALWVVRARNLALRARQVSSKKERDKRVRPILHPFSSFVKYLLSLPFKCLHV